MQQTSLFFSCLSCLIFCLLPYVSLFQIDLNERLQGPRFQIFTYTSWGDKHFLSLKKVILYALHMQLLIEQNFDVLQNHRACSNSWICPYIMIYNLEHVTKNVIWVDLCAMMSYIISRSLFLELIISNKTTYWKIIS